MDKPTTLENLELALIETNLIVTNKGPTLVRIQNTNLDLGFDQIPPFAKRSVPLKISSPNIILGGQRIIEITINDQTKKFTINFPSRLPAILTIAVVIAAGVWFIAKKSRHLSLFQ